MGTLSAAGFAAGVAVAGVVAFGGTARADKTVDYRVRSEVGFDMAMGTVGAGRESATGGGITVHYGRRFDRLLLRGELGPHFLSWSATPDAPQVEDVHGSLVRADLVAQYAFARFRDRKELSFDLFVEGGAGREWISWDGGGTLHRDTLIAAVGADYVLRVGQPTSRARALRAFMTLRWTFTPSPAQDAPTPGVMCAAGPGDTTCPPASTTTTAGAAEGGRDVGVQLSVGFTFGW